jgi:hypothetical protein
MSNTKQLMTDIDIMNTMIGNFPDNLLDDLSSSRDSYDSIFKFIVDGVIHRDAERVDFRQDNKIINLRDGKSSILPNLIVDNNDIEASHSAYIGTFDEDKKFYMMSRGLTSEESDDLLIKAFLLNDMVLDEKERNIYCSIIESINK